MIITHTNVGSPKLAVGYKANVKSNTAPEVAEQFIDDEGEVQYILSNGNTQPKLKYDAIWNPKKGIVNTNKMYKGENPDRTKEWYKP